MIQLQVRLNAARRLQVPLDPTTTIANAKKAIAEAIGTPFNIRLAFGGRILIAADDSKTLTDLGIDSQTVVSVIISKWSWPPSAVQREETGVRVEADAIQAESEAIPLPDAGVLEAAPSGPVVEVGADPERPPEEVAVPMAVQAAPSVSPSRGAQVEAVPLTPLLRIAREAAQVRILLAPFNEAEQTEIETLQANSNLSLSDIVVIYQRANLNAEAAAATILRR
jgi:hypothetical protein